MVVGLSKIVKSMKCKNWLSLDCFHTYFVHLMFIWWTRTGHAINHLALLVTSCEKWYCIGICFPVMASVFFEPEGYKLTYVACGTCRRDQKLCQIVWDRLLSTKHVCSGQKVWEEICTFLHVWDPGMRRRIEVLEM